MQVASFFERNDIAADLQPGNKEDVLRKLASLVVLNHPELEEKSVFEILLKREQLRSTGMEDGVAFPHGRVPGLGRLIFFFARCRAGVDFKSFDGKPTHFFFVLLIPEDAQGVHLKALARLNALLQKAPVRQRLLQASSSDEIYQIITQEDGH